MNDYPQSIQDEINERRAKCPFIDEGRHGCLLRARPDLTEQDAEGTYYHATCGKKWEGGHYDQDFEPVLDDEECHAHPIFIADADGCEEIADWG